MVSIIAIQHLWFNLILILFADSLVVISMAIQF